MPAFVKSYIQRFERNVNGRDFVASDVHGNFTSLKYALGQVGFRTARDRLFCVGDLIDRGPESYIAPGLLAQPWFHAIRGNHEDQLLQEANGGGERPWRARKESTWFWNMNPGFRAQLTQQLTELPIILEIETFSGIVGMVHGDVPYGLTWQKFKERIASPSVLKRALYGRERVINRSEDFVSGVDRVFLGHTRVMRPTVFGNCCAIDTGATSADGDAGGFSSGMLTVLDLELSLAELANLCCVKAEVEDVSSFAR